MYLEIGENKIARIKNILGIFDFDTCTQSPLTVAYLADAERDGRMDPTKEIPKSFVVTTELAGDMISLSPLNAQILAKRSARIQKQTIRSFEKGENNGSESNL